MDVTASIGLRFGFLLPAGIAGLVIGASLIGYAVAVRRRAAHPVAS